MRNAEIHGQQKGIARTMPMNPYYINARRIADYDWYQLSLTCDDLGGGKSP
jgi:hypothetical protein